MNIQYIDVNGICSNCKKSIKKGWVFIDERGRIEQILCDNCRGIQSEIKPKKQKLTVKEVKGFIVWIYSLFTGKKIYEVISSTNIVLPDVIGEELLIKLLDDPNIDIRIKK